MKRIFSIICVCLSLILALCGILSVVTLHNNASFSPEYEMVDLAPILEKEILSTEDYKTLFYQTGLGKYAIDSLRETETFEEEIQKYQKNFFRKTDYVCETEAITTCMEYFVSDKGYYRPGFEIFPVKEGYVLLMESSHSLGWRHGHAGLVVNNGFVLEAPIIGQPSMEYSLGMWEYYSSFVMLRLKDASDEDLKNISNNAQRYLNGIVYNPFAGIFKKEQGKKPKTVQCAYLVWYAFYSMGIDIDSDGGNLVTVKDIKNSDKFEVVQIYGYNPDDFIK